MSDFSENLLKERCRYLLRRRDVSRALGVLGKDGAALIRKYELGEAVPTFEQFSRMCHLLPRLVAHPPEWPDTAMRYGSLDIESTKEEVARKVARGLRDGSIAQPERCPPLSFGRGLMWAIEEDRDPTDDGVDMYVEDVGGYDGAKNKLEAMLKDEEPPTDGELAAMLENYPSLRGLLATGACRRPTNEKKQENKMQLIQPLHDKPARKQLGELIQRARVQRELSHRDLAERCGVNADDVKWWETGDGVPRGRQWARLKGSLYSLQAAALVWQAALREVAADEVEAGAMTSAPLGVVVSDHVDIPHEVEQKVEEEEKEAEEESEVVQRRDEQAQPVGEVTPPPPLQDPRTQTRFGSALRIARINLGFTQDELGELIGVSGTAISSWETESVTPVLENWMRLTSALPELRECAPPGVRDIDMSRFNSGRQYPRPRTVDPLVERPPAPKAATPVAPAAKDAIAMAGIDYANSLRDVKVADARVRKLKEELARAEASHQAATVRADEAQRALVRLVDAIE